MPKLKKLAKKAGKAAKKAAAHVARDPAVRQLAKQLGSQLKVHARNAASNLLLGSGDYKTSTNMVGPGTRFPGMTKSVRIVRREFVAPVVSSATAKGTEILKFRVNPGSYSSGYWISQVARGFQSWKPLQCRLVYEPTSGLAVSSDDTSLGKVVMAAQYNSYARDWDSIIEFQNARDSVTVDPAGGATLLLECKRSQRGAELLYVSAQDPEAAGKAFYDLCDVFVAITGLRGTSVRAGDLYFEWNVEFSDPILRDSELPASYYSVVGTVAGTTDSFIASSSGTHQNTVATTIGTGLPSQATATASALTLKIKPIPGLVRVNVLWLKYGTSGLRGAPATCTCVSSYLGNTVDSSVVDTSQVTGGFTGTPLDSTSPSTAYIRVFTLSPNVDQFVLTFGNSAGQSGDTVKCVVSLEALEQSDF
nr:MAG: hypothetical protein 3 [Sobelivirales sp.]